MIWAKRKLDRDGLPVWSVRDANGCPLHFVARDDVAWSGYLESGPQLLDGLVPVKVHSAGIRIVSQNGAALLTTPDNLLGAPLFAEELEIIATRPKVEAQRELRLRPQSEDESQDRLQALKGAFHSDDWVVLSLDADYARAEWEVVVPPVAPGVWQLKRAVVI